MEEVLLSNGGTKNEERHLNCKMWDLRQTQEQFAGAKEAFSRPVVLVPSGDFKSTASSLLPRQRPTCPQGGKINEQMSEPLPSRSGDKTELLVVGMFQRWGKKLKLDWLKIFVRK